MDTIEWDTYEHEYHEKTADWYWAVGIVAVSLAVAAILLDNIIFAILILVSAASLAIHSHKRPSIIHFEITPRGVIVGNIFHPFESIESFWVEDRDHDDRIFLKSKKLFMPYTIIPLGNVMPESARAYLLGHLKEERHSEHIFHKFLVYLGF